MSFKQGFTLIELVVVITIMTIVSVLVLTALPVARTNQEVENDIQQLRASLTQAQQKALNEIREDACLTRMGSDPDLQKRCSNIGVVFGKSRIRVFADVDDNKTYSEGVDYIIEDNQFVSTVQNGSGEVSIVFNADPPVIFTYVDGSLLSPEQTQKVTVNNKNVTRTFTIGPYGVIEYANQ